MGGLLGRFQMIPFLYLIALLNLIRLLMLNLLRSIVFMFHFYDFCYCFFFLNYFLHFAFSARHIRTGWDSTCGELFVWL